MNLFDVLSAGKRDLNEENVSSFFAWILDPKQTHGCGSLFLSRLLNVIDQNNGSEWEAKLDSLSVDVMVEEEVITANSSRRYVDIVLLISPSSEHDEQAISSINGHSLVFAIENKIRDGACKEYQLSEQLEGLRSSYKDSDICFQ